MNERSMLLQRLDLLSRSVASLRRVLDGSKVVEPRSFDRLSLRFAQLAEGLLRDLRELRKNVENGGGSMDCCWKEFQRIGRRSDEIAGESLAFLGGLLIRRYGLDERTCDVADRLCAELGARTQTYQGVLSVPAAVDAFTELSNIVRVRFPALDAWGLAAVAHEFGHFVFSEKQDRFFPDLLPGILEREGRAAGEADPQWGVLEEQFADLFAVHALGPAYVCACILLFFEPRLAHLAPASHPSDAERAEFLLLALGHLQEQAPEKPYHVVAESLRRTWEGSLTLAGQRHALAEDARSRVELRLTTMLEVMDNPAMQLAGARYSTERYSVARSLAGLVVQAESATKGMSFRARLSAAGHSLDAIRVTDVLNAAWVGRLSGKASPELISAAAINLCLEVP